MEIHQLSQTHRSESSTQTVQLELILGEQMNCLGRKYKMKSKKSEKPSPVVHVDHQCLPPPSLF